ncbi:lytic murein transglycosylase [Photobacterium ganghwense]|uniref:Lytic transglycosylase n=1 Tax=Photobacterium ganghwense TaxID=320778 RepID=A0A0J1KAE6_9GAMM|nr:lytic murein transglycosylase [Photobacterium ganghwense]KLV11287.1 lytic transglycosylase [Photobacterium ganghwense]PSU08130.1 lytic murein transglycosylase [Photobacterium ganghwense]QSV14940.1 lytic murein transglycosylase [Photobacterium ganghwense]
MRKQLITALVALGLGMSSAVMAADEGFDTYVNVLKTEAREKGISEQTIQSAFDGITFIERAVKADKNQPERKLTLDEYLPRAVPEWKKKQANQLYQEHKAVLDRIGQQYGVQPRFVVALWGVESNFGRLTGNYNVVEALTTLAYEGRREAFFRNQVMAALEIIDAGHITAKEMKGSWAGAMGQPQFMPTSFLAYARDGNNDGKADIWQTKDDVFASAANYLHEAGWNDEYTWGRQVSIPDNIDATLLGVQPEKGRSLSEWQKLGVRRMNGQNLPDTAIDAWLIQPDDNHGRAYLVYGNYQSLLKWNRSHYFALAVSYLADSIR